MLAFLTSASLYWHAVTLCQTFSLPVTSLTLAASSVKLASARGAELEQAWTWLTKKPTGRRQGSRRLDGGGGLTVP